MPVPTPQLRGEGTGLLSVSIEVMLPQSTSGRSATHTLDAQHERQNPKSSCPEQPQNTTPEGYFWALAIASIST